MAQLLPHQLPGFLSLPPGCILRPDYPISAPPKNWPTRRAHRAAEFVSFTQGNAVVLLDFSFADNIVQEGAITALNNAHASSGLGVRQHPRSKGHEHSPPGELASYFDGVWVLSGQAHERLICLRVDAQYLIPLHYCPDLSHKVIYTKVLKVWREANFSCPRAVNKKAVTYHKWCGSSESGPRGSPFSIPSYLYKDQDKHVLRNFSRFKLRAHHFRVESCKWHGGSSICDNC